mmetsp:Transcript_58742/g.166980  ORF Transcript_58742/g.166980 Transcript_58742/m.166980 type:complete len:386 (+) Transcript_58742:1299-2456(+)
MLYRKLVLVRGAPVGLHETAEAHHALEVALEDAVVSAGMRAIDPVVGAHDRTGAGLHRRLEGWVVELPGRALVHVDIVLEAVRLLLVETPVLEHGHDALALHAPDIGRGKHGAQVGVVPGHVLEVPAAPGRPVHLDRGPQQHVRALAPELAGNGRGHLLHEALVPGGAQREQRGPGRRRADGHVVEGPVAVGRVLHVQRGDAEPRDRGRVPRVHAVHGLHARDDARRPAGAPEEGVLLPGSHLHEHRVRLPLRLRPRERFEPREGARRHLGRAHRDPRHVGVLLPEQVGAREERAEHSQGEDARHDPGDKPALRDVLQHSPCLAVVAGAVAVACAITAAQAAAKEGQEARGKSNGCEAGPHDVEGKRAGIVAGGSGHNAQIHHYC